MAPNSPDTSDTSGEHDGGTPDAPTTPTAPVTPTTPVTPVTRPEAPVASASPVPGWYPDPWLGGHYRYWNGMAWTGDSFRVPDPSGPASPPSPPGPAEPLDQSGPATHGPYLSSGPSARDAPPAPPIPPASPPLWQGQPRWSRGQFAAVLILVAILVGSGSFAGAYFYHSRSQTLAAAPPSNLLPPSTPAALSRIALTQQDVGSTVNVQTISQGRSLGQPTLDLCNGTYPSESLRTSRLQVAASDSQGSTLLSTEAVLYRNAAATQQAFSELAAAASNCPSSPVQSPVGEPTVITKFNAAPDGSWPQVQGVLRQAYDFVATDGSGQTTHSVAVYMRRGRVLLGAYFSQPDAPQTSVAGQSTIATIQNVLAARIAQLPASEIGA